MSKATFTFTVQEKQELLLAALSKINNLFNNYGSYEEFVEENKALISAANKLNKAVPARLAVKKFKTINEYVRMLYERFSPSV